MDLNNAVIYQIYLRTFTSEGTLKAAEKLIPHISDLGADIIYLSVCNKEDDAIDGQSPRQIASGMNNPKNPYRVADYYDVDEEYGTLDDLRDFVCTAHKYGLKVLYDLVFLHCGENAVFLKDNPEFVIRDEAGEIIRGERWPFARFNYECNTTCEYLWRVMEYYIKELKFDGFRCDAGDYVPLDFWSEGIIRVRKINPEAIMLNEGDNIEWLASFDVNYMVNLTDAINDCFMNSDNSLTAVKYADKYRHMDGFTVSDLKKTIDEVFSLIPKGKFTLLNSESHDTVSDYQTDRPEINLGSDAAEAIMVLLFTLKGIPMIYNGCEVADSTEKNMFWNRFCKGTMSVQWQNALTERGKNRLAFVKRLIEIRKNNPALQKGEFQWVMHSAQESVLGFKREHNNKEIIVFVNPQNIPQKITVAEDQLKNVLLSQNTEALNSEISMKPYGFIIFEK